MTKSTMQSTGLLRRVLWADAASSAAIGVLLWSAADALEPLLGLPAALLRAAGAALLPFAALVALLAALPAPAPALVWAVVAVNVLWVLDTVALLVAGWVRPTTAGTTLMVALAVGVALMAELEVIGLRRARPASPALPATPTVPAAVTRREPA